MTCGKLLPGAPRKSISYEEYQKFKEKLVIISDDYAIVHG